MKFSLKKADNKIFFYLHPFRKLIISYLLSSTYQYKSHFLCEKAFYIHTCILKNIINRNLKKNKLMHKPGGKSV